MERSEVKFRARDQVLTFTGGIRRYASDTVNYVEACFELSDNWSGYDAVTAVWNNGTTRISAVLDSHGACRVPQEVLSKKGEVYVNLAGTTSAGGAVTERLTTYPVWVLAVDAKSHTRGAEQTEITPTQFEQFASAVRSDASDAREAASASAESAEASAQSASESAEQATESAESARSSSASATASAQSAGASAESAQSASESATSAENAKDDAETARDEILSMRAEATTLAEGSQATASYSDGVLTLGIPKGDTGATGAKGDKGDTGATPSFSIGTVETLEPTEDATATITGTAENPVLNLGIPKGDTGEVSLEDLEALLPTETASGDIVTITDGQSVIPAESLKVALEPIQDLNGYDKPWAGGAGRNLLNDSAYSSLERAEYSDNVFTGMLYAINTGAMVRTYNGTTTVDTQTKTPVVGSRVSIPLTVDSSWDKVFIGYRTNAAFNIGAYYDKADLNLADGEHTVSFLVDAIPSASVYGKFSYVQIESGSTATSWTPYENIAPISGWTDVDTHRTGVNVWDEEWEYGRYSPTTGEATTENGVRSKKFIKVTPSTDYFLACDTIASNDFRVLFYDEHKDFISANGWAYGNTTFTTRANAHYVKFFVTGGNYGTTYKNDISINYPSTDTEYHAYLGTTYTTDLGQTVYGGTLDVVSGELVVDRKGVTFDGSSDEDWRPYSGQRFVVIVNDYTSPLATVVDDIKANYLETIYKGAQGARVGVISGGDYTYHKLMVNMGLNSVAEMREYLAQNPLQVVYPLATPQTIQLTPQEVKLLLGTNNVWSDGNVTLVYSADIQKWVEKKLQS